MKNLRSLQNLSNLQRNIGLPYAFYPLFLAYLLSDLFLTRGTGDPTSSRASVGTVLDSDGVIRSVKSGEVRLEGARRVHNNITTPDLSSGSWTKSLATITGTNQINGQAGAWNVYFSTTNYYHNNNEGAVWVCRAKLSGTGKCRLSIQRLAGGTFEGSLTSDITLSSTPITYSVSYTPSLNSHTATGLVITRATDNSAATVTVDEPQLEFVSGKSNQNPSEYVSNGVLSAPYHGAGTDGVKNFTYQNGNTVTNYVLTEAKGSNISATTLKGFLSEPETTNIFTYTNALNNATYWNSGSATITANATLAPNGTTTAFLFDDTGASAIPATPSRTINALSSIHTYSIFTKKGNATTRVFSAYNNTTATALLTVSLNYDTGVATVTAGTNGTEVLTTFNNGWYRISLCLTSGITIGDSITYYYGRTATAGVGATDTWYLWEPDLTSLSYPSSHIYAPTATTTRIKDLLSYSATSNINTTQGSIYLEYTPKHIPITENIYLFGTYVDASNYTCIMHDGTNLIFRKRISGTNYDATIANTFASGTTYRVACSWGPSGSLLALGGVAGTPHANTTAIQVGTTLEEGSLNGSGQPTTNIKNLKIFPTQLPISILQGMTFSFVIGAMTIGVNFLIF